MEIKVIYTCGYISGPLIPYFSHAIGWLYVTEVGIKCAVDLHI